MSKKPNDGRSMFAGMFATVALFISTQIEVTRTAEIDTNEMSWLEDCRNGGSTNCDRNIVSPKGIFNLANISMKTQEALRNDSNKYYEQTGKNGAYKITYRSSALDSIIPIQNHYPVWDVQFIPE